MSVFVSVPVSTQPPMSLHAADDDKPPSYYDDHEAQWSSHSHAAHSHVPCHNTRLKRLLTPSLLILLVLSALAATAYLFYVGLGAAEADAAEMLAGLFHAKRAVVDGNMGSTGGSTFTRNKLYLIVVFVGLFVVLVLAVMLSAWCCRGAFENPLCCPCYLCACCGGLACLECIGCGLCAEGVEQM